jgi:hypothetical protein
MQYMSRRQRLLTVGLAAALALSLGGTIALTIAWLHDRDAARVALADDSRRLQALEIKVGSLTADRTGTPVQATVAPTAASIPPPPSPSGAPARSAAPTQSPANLVFARLTHVTDSLGSDWINAPMMGTPVHLKAGTSITFTAFATDELNRPLQLEFWRGDSPAQQIICGWGAASCTWTAVTPSACGPCNPTLIHVAVRDSAATHRLTPCFKTESCDDVQTLQYDVEPW